MRLDRVYIDGFKNLKGVDFDEERFATVVIGQNSAGKSNLIEAIDYRIGDRKVRLSNREGRPFVMVDGERLSRTAFENRQNELFPDLVFGYYSGG